MSLGAYLIPLLTLLPLSGAVLVLLLPAQWTKLIRALACTITWITLMISAVICLHYDTATPGFQLITKIVWLPSLGIAYQTGVDGISCVLILLHAICSLTAVLVSGSVENRVKEYYVLLLFLIASIFGVFTALDLFFLYVFYEMAVVPLYPMIIVWGSKNKEYGAMKLTLYVTLGAVLALVGLLSIYHATGLKTFDLIEIQSFLAAHPLDQTFQTWAALLLTVGFGVVASLWPLHSWSPIGYAAAPTAVSMLHAGVLKKIGIYAIIRLVLGLLPFGASVWMPYVAILAVINVLYGAWAAMAQNDLKFVIGFASVSHMGYALLGISAMTPLAVSGVVFFMFAHGVMAALSFALIGFIYHQTHTRDISDLGGLMKPLPFVGACFVMAALASSGLPGFANFVSEIIIFFGSWQVRPWPTLFAIFGIVVTATYMLRLVKNVFFGPVNRKWNNLKDAASFLERLPYGLLVLILLIFGCWPAWLLNLIRPSVALLPLLR